MPLRVTPFVLFFAALPASAAGIVLDPASAKPDPKADVLWYDARQLGVEGQGWADTKTPFDRLPAKAEALVRPPVWLLGRQSAGLCVRFVTDATALFARWTVTSKTLDLPHMPATGVSGLDLYARDDGKWRWVACKPATAEATAAQLAVGLPAGEREYLLYLPLYNGVSSVEIGLPKGVGLKRADPYPADRAKPIVFYGTSITQGASASRPGMTHVALLGRRFGVPVVNLGFSGNGTLDTELAALMSEIDAVAYVIDCLPNLHGPQVADRTEPFVKLLRTARPDVPIVLVEDRTYTNAGFNAALVKRNVENRAAFKKAFEALTSAGVKGLHYLPGDGLLGTDGEASVDGSHPTDLGFYRLAEAYAAVLGPILNAK